MLKGELGLRRARDLRLAGDPADPRRLPRPGAASVLAGIDMFMEPIQAPNNPNGWDVFIPTLICARRGRRGADEPDRRRRVAHPDRQVRARPFRGARSPTGATSTPIGSKAHRKVARRAVAESQVLLRNKQQHPAAQPPAEPAGLRRRQQRRQHRQPGRRLDADLAGRLDQRDPRPDRPRRRPGDVRGSGPVYSQTGGDPVPAQRRRRRRGRRDAVRRGLRGRRRPAVGLRPGRRRRPAAEEDDAAQRRRPAGDPPGLLARRVVHRPRRLRAADDRPAGAARPDRRAGRVVAPGQRGGWAWRTCCSGRSRSPASCR